MSTHTIITIIAVTIVLVIALAWGRGGPRVTQITRTREKKGEEE